MIALARNIFSPSHSVYPIRNYIYIYIYIYIIIKSC